MTFPFWSLVDERRALGLVLAVVLGFAFGFVLERAGFGRAEKLVAQFHGTDMTVLKVMFTAVVTAALGMVLLSGVGLFELAEVQQRYPTFLWPMIAGGLALGAGFVLAGYCPGTAYVGVASGKLDALAAVGGVVIGTVLYSEVEPALGSFPTSGELGAFSLSTWLRLPAPVVAALLAAAAGAAFLGADRVERLLGGQVVGSARARKMVFGVFVVLAALAIVTLAMPARTSATP